MLNIRFWFQIVLVFICWNLTNSGFINEPCNERNTLYITSYFKKISKKTQCLDISEINPILTKQRNFLEVYDYKHTRQINTIYAENIGLLSIPKVEKFLNLEEYHLPNNKIRTIPPNSFRRNNKLRLLILNKNNIQTRRNQPIAKSASLKILILSMNNIAHIDKKTFVLLPNVHTLLLDNNKIQHLPYDAFRNQRYLKYLRVNRNPLKSLSIYLPINVQLITDIPNTDLEIDDFTI